MFRHRPFEIALAVVLGIAGCEGDAGIKGHAEDGGHRGPDAGIHGRPDAGHGGGGGEDAGVVVHTTPGGAILETEPGVDPALAMRAADAVPSAANDSSLTPQIVYPQDRTEMPPNLYLVKWQWQPVSHADLYVTTFTGGSVTVDYVSRQSSFVLSPTTWRALALANRSGTVTVTVRAVRSSDLTHAGSASIQISIGADDLMGALYYFSTTRGEDTQGIFRYDFGVPVASANQFLTMSAAGECVGCHALSSDGTHMGVTFKGGFGYMSAIDVTRPQSYLFGGTGGPQRGAFIQYFDNDRELLAVYDNMPDDMSDPLNGQIRMYDAASGAPMDGHDVPLTSGTLAAHVAVAPDGLTIAYVQYTDTDDRPIHMFKGSIVVRTYDRGAGTWGPIRMLVQCDGRVNNYYPSFSPDSQWIMFDRAEGDAYDNPDATIWVVRADGSAPPIELSAANRAAHVTNSWPRWAPFIDTTATGTRLWFAFSSKRDYGLELTGGDQAQLWMASFDPAAARGGTDPSRPAFWLPFQSIETKNHTPSWTGQVVEPQCRVDPDCGDTAFHCDLATGTCQPNDTLI